MVEGCARFTHGQSIGSTDGIKHGVHVIVNPGVCRITPSKLEIYGKQAVSSSGTLVKLVSIQHPYNKRPGNQQELWMYFRDYAFLPPA